MSVDNLRIVFERATTADVRSAMDSYWKYNQMVTAMATKHGFTTKIGAGVFSALSPNNDYHGNLRDAHSLIAAAGAGKSIDDFKVSTYGPNKRKAWAIVNGTDPLELIVAKKTRNFFLNINDPTDIEPICIDGHMFNMWLAQRVSLVGLSVRSGLYDEVAAGVRQFAAEKGVIPWQMQGILWLTWRRIHGIFKDQQREFWDVDYIAARLPWQPARI